MPSRLWVVIETAVLIAAAAGTLAALAIAGWLLWEWGVRRPTGTLVAGDAGDAQPEGCCRGIGCRRDDPGAGPAGDTSAALGRVDVGGAPPPLVLERRLHVHATLQLRPVGHDQPRRRDRTFDQAGLTDAHLLARPDVPVHLAENHHRLR